MPGGSSGLRMGTPAACTWHWTNQGPARPCACLPASAAPTARLLSTWAFTPGEALSAPAAALRTALLPCSRGAAALPLPHTATGIPAAARRAGRLSAIASARHGGAPHPRLGMSRALPRRPSFLRCTRGWRPCGRSGPGALASLQFGGEVGFHPGAATAGSAARRLILHFAGPWLFDPPQPWLYRRLGFSCRAGHSLPLLTCPARALR